MPAHWRFGAVCAAWLLGAVVGATSSASPARADQGGGRAAPAPASPPPSSYAPAPAPAPAPGPSASFAPSGDLRFENFEFRFGGSLGFDVIDTGASRLPGLTVGGFAGIDFQVWFECRRDSEGCFGLSMIANLLDLRAHLAGHGDFGGGTQDGAGVVFRNRLDVTPGSYFQAWLGYWFVGDAQATFPTGDDLLAFWHLAFARFRVVLAPVAIELGGGLSDSNQGFHAGVRFALGSNWHLGAEIDGYFNNGESATYTRTAPGSQRWGRELWIGHLFLAVDFGDF